ncbi:MAG: hypothetical protein ABIZ04_03155 [Opitutus sp.]
MSTSSFSASFARASDPPSIGSLPAAFAEQLSRLYAVAQRSPFVFGSPLGPFTARSRPFHLPRFVYFGPRASDAAFRISFLAGFDHRDLRSTLALLRLVEGLARKPDLGEGLNLTFFPLLDVLGLAGIATIRRLESENWIQSTAPEIGLLEKDARVRAYHGFVRLEAATGEDLVSIRLRSPVPNENPAPELELFSSEDVDPLAVRWEHAPAADAHAGPLGVADDLPVHPFELTVRIPAAWSVDQYAETTVSILKRFVLRYRGFMSYAQNL